jgi:amino acid transporter
MRGIFSTKSLDSILKEAEHQKYRLRKALGPVQITMLGIGAIIGAGIFAKVHPYFRTPWGSTIITGVAVGGAAMFTSLNEMVDLTNIGTLFAFILVCMGTIMLRVKDPSRKRTFRVPGGIAIPILGIIGCIGLVYYLPPASWLRFAAWLDFGILIYVCYGSLRSKLTGKSAETDHNLLMVKTAYNGAWLGIFGTALLFMARIADIKRVGLDNYTSTLFINSWWLTIPVLLNVLILCPTILSRALRAKTSPLAGKQNRYANLAILVSSVLCMSSIFYLLLVWIF